MIIAVGVVVLTLSLALAGAKITNKDTAKDRRTNTIGTDPSGDTATTTFGTDEAGDTTIKSKARPKQEEVDWYDKVIITVNPETKWPTSGTSSSSSTSTSYDNATDTETKTTTTQEKNW
jgi:hypothetical protein